MSEMFGKVKYLLLVFMVLVFTTDYSLAQEEGAAIFKANCATCHSPGARRGTGPGLQGFWDRIPGGDDAGKTKWYLNWVKNSATIVNSGKDPYINKLYKEYGSVMTPQPHLSDEELLAVKEYIITYEPPVDVADSGGKQNPFIPVKEKTDYTTMLWLVSLAIIFIILVSALGSIKNSLQKSIAVKDDKEFKEPLPFPKNLLNWFANHKLQTGLLIILVAFIAFMQLYYSLMSVGVYQGYKPEQPIKFSHAIHAGENGISCIYCHHSAEKSAHSGIPSVNVCMNCHKGIQKGTWTGTEEIAKIYEASGFNPETGKYDGEQKPIKWIRIHNLPDLAYFNHSQHVTVGEIECQTCHGPVEEMHELYQYSELTMGWCINCHRETEVAGLAASDDEGEVAKNPYYQKMFNELRAQHKDVEVFQVEDIGGLECSKCHY